MEVLSCLTYQIKVDILSYLNIVVKNYEFKLVFFIRPYFLKPERLGYYHIMFSTFHAGFMMLQSGLATLIVGYVQTILI